MKEQLLEVGQVGQPQRTILSRHLFLCLVRLSQLIAVGHR